MNYGQIFRFFFLLLLFIQVQSTRTTAVFVITWLAGHCQFIQGKCDPNVINKWDHKSFTINGLWPSDQLYDQEYGEFNLTLLKNSNFFDEMKLYWPPQPQRGGKPYFLWELQWKDHGSAYGDIVLQQYPQKFAEQDEEIQNEEIQLSYFKTCLTLYKSFNLTNMSTNLVKKSQLALRMNISQKSFYLICTQSGVLREIRICINFYSTGAKAFDCNRVNKFCDNAIVLKDWVNTTVKTQLQPKVAEEQNKAMQAIWKVNQSPQQKKKEVPPEQKAEIQVYEKEVSQEQLRFSNSLLEGTNYTLLIILILVALVMVGFCIFYLRKQSQERKSRLRNEIQTDNEFQLSQTQSKKDNQFAEP